MGLLCSASPIRLTSQNQYLEYPHFRSNDWQNCISILLYESCLFDGLIIQLPTYGNLESTALGPVGQSQPRTMIKQNVKSIIILKD